MQGMSPTLCRIKAKRSAFGMASIAAAIFAWGALETSIAQERRLPWNDVIPTDEVVPSRPVSQVPGGGLAGETPEGLSVATGVSWIEGQFVVHEMGELDIALGKTSSTYHNGQQAGQ